MKQLRSSFMLLGTAMALFFMSCGGGKSETDEKAADTTATAVTPEPAPAPVNTIITTPQLSAMVMHKVKDFDKWLVAYEADDSSRLANGIHSYVIGRGVNDPNMVLVVMKADDLEKAKARMKDPALKKLMQKAGVVGTPDMGLYTTTWQDTVNIGDVIRSRTTFTIKDWAAWEKNFQEGKQERMDNGVTDRAYGHMVDDDKKVSLVTAVMDTAKAFAYWKSDALKKRRAAGGVMGEPKRFLFHIVKRYH